MFGLESLDIIIGLFFVYLLLSLICTAVNEYIASLTNRRGKLLVRGINDLLRDVDAPEVAQKFFDHRLIRGLYTPKLRGGKEREPSYIPARTFAMTLLDVMGLRPDVARKLSTRSGISKRFRMAPPVPRLRVGRPASHCGNSWIS
jgi:hypothetical protein